MKLTWSLKKLRMSIEYKSMNVQHPQVQEDRRPTLTEFIKEGKVKLRCGKQYLLTDMAVTSNSMSISLIADVMS
jgi:hypothetical protein